MARYTDKEIEHRLGKCGLVATRTGITGLVKRAVGKIKSMKG